MPITVTRDAYPLLVATADGQVSVAALSEFVRTARHGELRLRPMLLDARTATFEMSAGDLRDVIAPMMAQLRAAGERAAVAIVVEDQAAFKMARMFETLMADGGVANFGVFRDVRAAEEWLAGTVDPRR